MELYFAIFVSIFTITESKVRIDSEFVSIESETEFLSEISLKPLNYGDVPSKFDWREHDGVTPIKNQLSCNAGWAFSVIANLESHYKIRFHLQEIFSEQFLIDCLPSRAGCNNFEIAGAFGEIINIGWVLSETDYRPYVHKQMECNIDGSVPLYLVSGFKKLHGPEEIMHRFIYRYGPVSAHLNSHSMLKYVGGIDEPSIEDCSHDDLNHAVLIVGYNSIYDEKQNRTIPYWIIKNSWGSGWGDNGYYYLVRNRRACGLSHITISFVGN